MVCSCEYELPVVEGHTAVVKIIAQITQNEPMGPECR
jgi:hypothetical protein